jgi:hypothetical protein
MNILRFILPFLFVRNWYDGSFELSRTRLALFGILIIMISAGIAIVSYLQAPIMYSATVL